ncbi:bark storage protein A-like [Papaver somniferum]|uniref:bark storage protein A-like n=1 Tax=Papaver somniferum TaxID=3469 RepID=UPI000E6FBC2B|nr:bark storage protein A-like [Papaver somniferum]
MAGLRVVITVTLLIVFTVLCCNFETSEAAFSHHDYKLISKVNKDGPYSGLLVSKNSELQPFLKSPGFHLHSKISHVVLSGRRFYIGHIGDRKMIVAVTGMGMMNAAITTQMLCGLFKIKHILHYGLASNADSKMNMGDIVIPEYWAHTGYWNWQRYGYGPDDELAFEEEGYFSRDYGYLKFSDYYTNKTGGKDKGYSCNNDLNNIWYQPEEIFHAGETKDSVFWVPTPYTYYETAKKLEVVALKGCTKEGTYCLQKTPKVVTVNKGSSASMYIDNYAYKNFLNSKFHVSSCDMEGAAIALVCHQHYIPFLGFKALHDYYDAPNPAQPPSCSPPTPPTSPPPSTPPTAPPPSTPPTSPPPSPAYPPTSPPPSSSPSPSPSYPPHYTPPSSPFPSSSSSRSLYPSISPFSSPSIPDGDAAVIAEEKSSIYGLLIENCVKVTHEFITKYSHHMSDDVSVSSS